MLFINTYTFKQITPVLNKILYFFTYLKSLLKNFWKKMVLQCVNIVFSNIIIFYLSIGTFQFGMPSSSPFPHNPMAQIGGHMMAGPQPIDRIEQGWVHWKIIIWRPFL